MAALSPADKQRAYRERNAARLAAQRPERIREVLESLVVEWTANAAHSGLVCQAQGAVEFAHAAGLIDEAEHDTLRGLIAATELPDVAF